MSNLFNQGMGRTAATTQTQAMGIDLQGSQYGPPIPVVYGQNRVGGNVIWYGDFRSLEHTQKVGKGFGGGTSSSYTYSASYLNGLCEGPIVGIANVWSGNSIVLLSTLAPFSATGTASQAPWSHLTAPGNLSYAYTALFGVENMALGGSPTLPNYNYEVAGLLQFGSGILDANAAAILTDICTSTTHGVPFNYLGTLTQYSDYCVANGLFLSPVYDQQSSAVQVLTDLFRNTNAYAWFSEGLLKVAPLGDVAVTGNGVTYTPDVTPLVNLGAGDFIVSGSGSPVTVQRKAPQDALNSVSVQFVDRANSYHNSAVVASIDEDMIANGARMAQTVNINGCVTASVARFIAQNMVQRAYYVRNTYTFKLSWRYCYLEPADLVTLTDVNTGLNLFPVRILEVAEDAEGLLDITAEEFPEGIGHSAIYNTQPNAGTNIDPLSDPGPVNAPLLFRGPGFLVGGGNPEIWCAVCGSGAEWGGADLYISYDGTTYNYLGSVNAPARYGTLTSDLPQPPPADPDITTVLGVQLYAPAVLLGGTQADADNLSTLCIAGSEVFAYETATLTGTEAYNLTYLRRNVYGTSNPATVGSGEFFARLDDAIFRFPVDPSLIGTTIYLKFLSVNAFGRTPRTLAEETAYTYVVGSSVELPDVPPTPANFTALAVADGVQLSWTNAVPAAVSAVAIYRSANSTGIFDLVGEVGNTTTSWVDHFTNGASWYYYVTARGPLNASGWSANSPVISGTGKTVADGATVGATLGTNLVQANGSTVVSNLDQFPDGSTYLRMPGANMDSNRRGLIDFSQVGHLNKVLDNIGDGSTYARVLGGRLQNNVPVLPGGANNLVPNATLARNNVGTPNGVSLAQSAAATDGWFVGVVSGGAALQWNNGGGYQGTGSFQISVSDLSPIPSGTYFPSFATHDLFPVQAGDVITIGARFSWNSNFTLVANLSINATFYAVFFDINGNNLGNVNVATGFNNYGFNNSGAGTAPLTNSGVVPANAVKMQFLFEAQINNATGSAYTIATGDFQIIQCTGMYAMQQSRDLLTTPAILAAGATSTWQNLSITYTASAGSPATATISVSAAQILGMLTAGALVSYNASSASVTGTGGTSPTYYLYYIDPAYTGGTQTLYATTNGNDLRQQLGIVYIGSVVVAFPTSGSGGGSGGGGLCVTERMFIRRGRRAVDAIAGEIFDCADFP
ncbi:MAG: phage tail protein, partial [Steroidobacteraceae bacterium]